MPRPCSRRRASAAADAVAVAVFPELCLTGYSIDDLVMQDAVLDAVETAIARLVEASADLFSMLVVGAPLRHRNRLYNCAVVIHRGELLGVAPKSYLPTYREFYERRWYAAGDDQAGEDIRVGDLEAPFGPDLLFEALDVPGLVVHAEVCEDVWVPIPPSSQAALAGCHGAAQPQRQPDHDRPGRGPQGPLPVPVAALPRRLCVCGRRHGRVDERPVVGRPDDDLRGRHAPRRDRALSRRPTALGRRRRPRPAPPGSPSPGHVRRQPPHRWTRSSAHGSSAPCTSSSTRRRRTSDCAARSTGSRSCPTTRQRLAQDCYEAFNIQVVGTRAAHGGDRPAASPSSA